MDVTLQYFDDCPNWRIAAQHLSTLADEFDDLRLELQVIDTPDDAERYRFRGSPSILVDGVDPFAGPDDPIGLSCRVYTTADGPAGSPTLDQLRTTLAERARRSGGTTPVERPPSRRSHSNDLTVPSLPGRVGVHPPSEAPTTEFDTIPAADERSGRHSRSSVGSEDRIVDMIRSGDTHSGSVRYT